MPTQSPTCTRAEKIAVLLPSLEGGGAERSMLNLATGFLAKGREVDIVLCQAKGAFLDEIPAGATMIELEATGGLRARWIIARSNLQDFFVRLRPVLLAKKTAPEVARIRSLQRYIVASQPDVILSALPYANLSAIWAKELSGSRVPVIVSERIALSSYCAAPSNSRKWRWRYLPELVRRTYPKANRVVAVSDHVADELITTIGLHQDSVITVHNPVVDDNLRTRAQQPLEHPWFAQDEPPVILAAGRFTEQKDFATLIRAFAAVRADREARLVILGEGRLRDDLEQLVCTLGIQADVYMPGFVENPFQYMARASVLVLSSAYEGLPGVLIQALACGCPVVSTDCPGGSSEILEDGNYGALVSIGNADEMAKAVLAELDDPTPREILLRRAEDFSVERAVNNYLALLDTAVNQAADRT
ncbi:glycosyltransferase [Halioglobus sp. Uisw_031]|uniref:glycosyltransferase n=1 Tax=Halioglobus sp. Uisw_031 TaxID=3230977 RepID=UPI0039E7D266